MSFDAIASVSKAEAEGKAAQAAAEQRAKQMLAEAEAAGKAAVEAALTKAEAELSELRKETDKKAAASTAQVFDELENKKTVMRSRAEARLEKAASLIVERIVNG